MIWVRRFLVIPLGLVFFVLLAVTLVVFRASETLLQPQFYKEQLARADIYNFVLGELPTAALEELRQKGQDFFSETLDENPMDMIGLTTDEIVSSVGRALPPSWVQEQVERVIDQAGGYMTGEQDGFRITVTAGERVKATAREVEALIRRAKLYYPLLDEIVAPEIDKALAQGGALPLNVSISEEDLVAALQQVTPEDWVTDRVVQALNEVTAYMVGDRETFEVDMPLAERADVALTEMKTLLMKANFFELLFDEVMDPMLEGSLSQFTELSFGVGITQEETASALRELVSTAWLEEQALVVIDEVGPYLTGRTNSFRAVIPMADRGEVALSVIQELAQSKLNALVEALPECGTGQLPFLGITPSLDELPECVPPGVQVQALIDRLDIDISGGVREMIGSQIPDQLVYTQADLRDALVGADSEGTLEVLDNMRQIMSQGWAYTDIDLRADLLSTRGKDSVVLLDDVRAALSDGWTYTDVDLREDLTDAGQHRALDKLDTFRSLLGRARDLRFLVYVVWALLLAGIGVLGGRHWRSKIGWAAATLGVAAAVAFAASGPVYESYGQSKIDDLRVEAVEGVEGTRLLAVEKGLDLLQTVADDFLAGIERSSLTLLVVALVVLGILVAWPKVFGRGRSSVEGAEAEAP